MLSTVVLPAPFGPIRLVTSPGARLERDVVRRPHAAEGDAQVPRPPGPRAARGDRQLRLARAARGRASVESRRETAPTTPSGATHSTPSSSAPKNSSRYSARPASTSGSSTTIAAPTSGPATEPAPPMITTSTNRIDCEKAKVEGVTKPDSAANSAPATPAHTAEMANAAVLIADRVEADRFGGDLRIAHRAHRLAPAAARQAPEGEASPAPRRRMLTIATPRSPIADSQAGLRDPHDAVLPAGHAAPLDRHVLDDEAEGDGDHREVRPLHAQRRQREQRADQPESSAATGSASQKLHFARR